MMALSAVALIALGFALGWYCRRPTVTVYVPTGRSKCGTTTRRRLADPSRTSPANTTRTRLSDGDT